MTLERSEAEKCASQKLRIKVKTFLKKAICKIPKKVQRKIFGKKLYF